MYIHEKYRDFWENFEQNFLKKPPFDDGFQSFFCWVFEESLVLDLDPKKRIFAIVDVQYSLYTWRYQVNGPILSIMESDIQPLFEDSVKTSNFKIFIDSDRKKFEFYHDIHC